MFKNAETFFSFSVNDLGAAQKFYGETLGLAAGEDSGGMGLLELTLANTSRVMVYPKPDHSPATFTVLNFLVDDIEESVDELMRRGVKFEHYDTENVNTDEKGIASGGGTKIAWFKDPAGNILSVIGS